MKKLQIQTASGWQWVFCHDQHRARVTTTPDKPQALPTRSSWGADDMAYFSQHFPGDAFRLAETLEGAEQ